MTKNRRQKEDIKNHMLNINLLKSLTLILIFTCSIQLIQAQVPSPEDVFGFKVGADYKLADYDQMLEFYDKLDAASDRVKMIDIGKSVMGRPIKLLFISSEENLMSLERWQDISEKLARARITEEEARELAEFGRAVVWIDGGMHATERACAQMTNELAYKIATEETQEMKKIRNNVITLLAPVVNPDGLDIVVDWYRQNLGTPYETSRPPILYQKYVGHDNNRDWFMNNMPETQHITQVLYREWYPQIVLNHHQTSPAWARIFLPPFRSPVNPRIHPGITTGVNLVGSAMSNRFAIKKMPGVISNVRFSMWWNGGMRTAPYYHNMIGILTETAHAIPTPRYYDPAKKPKTVAGLKTDGSEIFYPYPWEGGESHFRDAIDYMITSSMAVLDLAADKKEEFLYNIYEMGRDAIENEEEAFAYIIPAQQWDNGEARNLVNVLLRGGLEATVVEEPFTVEGKSYDVGSVIFYGAQPFRPFLVDMLEKQEYPNQYQYPGGPPVPPYDLAGWTLPMQMGVTVDRIDKPFKLESDFVPIEQLLSPSEGMVLGNGKSGFLMSNRENDAYKIVNHLQKMGMTVSLLLDATEMNNRTFPIGSFHIQGGENYSNELIEIAKKEGVTFTAVTSKLKSESQKMAPIKLGLYKSWGPNMDEGWTRWVLEQYAFELDTLHDEDIRTKNLSEYTAIILPDESPQFMLNGHRPGTRPEFMVGGMGLIGAAALKSYVEKGGTLITFDDASDFAINHFGLPIRNVTKGLSNKQFFIPGSLIRASVDTKSPLANGMQEEIATSFSRSRAFEIFTPSRMGEGGKEDIKEAPKPNAKVIVKYAEKDLLMSGWASGEDRYLKNKAAMIDIEHGDGNVILFAFRPQFRGQPRGTYKLIFNAIHQAAITNQLP